MITHYAFPTNIHFGNGARHLLKEHVKSTALVVTDSFIPTLSWFQELIAPLDVSVFDGVAGNPVMSQVEAGMQALGSRELIIAIGGGAPTDVAKGIVRAANRPIPIFAIPTTAGTGSEVGRSGVVSDDHTHIKEIFTSPAYLPTQVFADPQVTVSLPKHLTAATGMDAITHNLEAFLAKEEHPMCEGIALEGLHLAKEALPRCYNNPNDLEARAKMLQASIMGAVAFQKGLGAAHSMAHALSTVCDLHHGLACGIVVPYAMRFNKPHCEAKFARLGDVIGWLEALKEQIGVARHLKEVGVSRDQLEQLVDVAVKDPCHECNPVPVSRKDFVHLFEEAIG